MKQRWEYQPGLTRREGRWLAKIDEWPVVLGVALTVVAVVWAAALISWDLDPTHMEAAATIPTLLCGYALVTDVALPLWCRRSLRRDGRAFKFPAGPDRDEYDALVERVKKEVAEHHQESVLRELFHAYRYKLAGTWGWNEYMLSALAAVERYAF